jgi:hypothetical protein
VATLSELDARKGYIPHESLALSSPVGEGSHQVASRLTSGHPVTTLPRFDYPSSTKNSPDEKLYANSRGWSSLVVGTVRSRPVSHDITWSERYLAFIRLPVHANSPTPPKYNGTTQAQAEGQVEYWNGGCTVHVSSLSVRYVGWNAAHVTPNGLAPRRGSGRWTRTAHRF